MAIEEQAEYNYYHPLDHALFRALGQRLAIPNRTVTKLGFWLMKEGIGLAGNLYFEINRASDDGLIVSKKWGIIGDVPPSAATYLEVTFDSPALIDEEVRIYARVTGGTADNHIGGWGKDSDVKADEVWCRYRVATGSWEVIGGYDFAYRYTYSVAPTVTTDAATGVTANASTPNGTLDDDGEEACDCGFEWGETIAYGNTTPTQSKVTGETFSQAISGLDPATTYHFRAFATNSAGTSYGADRTFTTLGVASSVTTDPATGVGMVLADLNGTLDDDGGVACDCGFQWGETVAYGNTTSTQSKVTGETFSQAISGLTPGTTYHFRASSNNVSGTSYGADRTFTTKEAISRGYALSRHEL